MSTLKRAKDALIPPPILQTNAQPTLTQPCERTAIPEQNALVCKLLAQLEQGLLALDQQIISSRGVGLESRNGIKLCPKPRAFLLHPLLNAPLPTLQANRVVHHSHSSSNRQTIHRPRISPSMPSLQTIGCRNGIAKTQPRNRKQFRETADHHKIGMVCHQGQ